MTTLFMMNLDSYLRTFHHHGLLAVIHRLLIAAVNRILIFNIVYVFKSDYNDESSFALATDSNIDIQFLGIDELADYLDKESYYLPASQIKMTLARGDRCVGSFVNGKLAGYSWFTQCPMESDDLISYISKKYTLGHKSLTLAQYRGLNLHLFRKSFAANFFKKNNILGELTFIDSHNISSIKGIKKCRSIKVATIIYFRLFKKYFFWHSPACKLYGMYMRAAED